MIELLKKIFSLKQKKEEEIEEENWEEIKKRLLNEPPEILPITTPFLLDNCDIRF